MDVAHTLNLDLLHADPRPTCVIDARWSEVDATTTAPPHVHFTNRALREQIHLWHDILQDHELPASAKARLRAWITHGDAKSTSFECFDGHAVFGYSVDRRWRVVQWQWTGRDERANGITVHAADGAITEHAPTKPLDIPSHTKPKDVVTRRNDAADSQLASMLTMMGMIDVGMFECDLKGTLISASEAFYKLSGHLRVSDERYSWTTCLCDESKISVQEHWARLTQGFPRSFEMKWKPRFPTSEDDEEEAGQWVLAACVSKRDEAGQVIGVSGCIMDIAAQKRSETDALKGAQAMERAFAGETRFGSFADVANVGIFIVDLNKQMLYCNREWYAITGHPDADFPQVCWQNFVVEDDLALIDSHWNAMMETKQAAKFQFRLRRTWTNGQGGSGQAYVMCCIYPEPSKDGSITTVAGFLADISHLIWAENVQKQRTDEAIEAKRQQENFIDMTCHEIRNPLGAVVHCADLIDNTSTEMSDLLRDSISRLTPEQRTRYDDLRESNIDAVNTIMACSTHQKRIMDDILTLSKLDSKLLTIDPSPARLDDILNNVERMFEVDARKVGVTLRAVKDASPAQLGVDWVILDTGRLMQVLINLITNALKFTQKEAVRIVTLSMGASRRRLSELELGVEFVPVSLLRERKPGEAKQETEDQVYLYFKIEDTGCGFGEEQKLTIFERFAQASPRTHSKYGGSGLGLAIVRELIELQGGEIGVNSRPGVGATFAFYVMAQMMDAPVVGHGQTDSLIPGKVVGSRAADLSYSILVVEDNLVNQKVLRKQLEKLGHTVYVVSNGVEALSFLETTSCWQGNAASAISLSVVLMDIEMPVMDGITCARLIRQAQTCGDIVGHVPVIAVSANARHEQVSHAIECGMDDAISKPFRVAELIPKIERLSAGQGKHVG